MNYESIILELMNRIQTLEQKVSNIEMQMFEDEEKSDKEDKEMGHKNIKITTEMLNACYDRGKKTYLLGSNNFAELAEEVSSETGMTQSTAQMYIIDINAMLHGNYFNRSMGTNAAQLFFDRIEQDFGKSGLQNAITALEQHIRYMNSMGYPVRALCRICKEYKEKL